MHLVLKWMHNKFLIWYFLKFHIKGIENKHRNNIILWNLYNFNASGKSRRLWDILFMTSSLSIFIRIYFSMLIIKNVPIYFETNNSFIDLECILVSKK